MNIEGIVNNIKRSQRQELEKLYKETYTTGAFCTQEQANVLLHHSKELKRQIGLIIDRKGNVLFVIIGNHTSILIPELPVQRTAKNRLRGLRLLHTHLNDELLTQEDLMDLLFLRLDYCTVLTMTKEGTPHQIQCAHLSNTNTFHIYPPTSLTGYKEDHIPSPQEIESTLSAKHTNISTSTAILISVDTAPKEIQEYHIQELREIAKSLSLSTPAYMIQRIKKRSQPHTLSKDKLAELEILALQHNADLLLFDGELSASQRMNLSKVTDRTVIDRTQLILEIFSKNAHTKEGKVQVEIAQLSYEQSALLGQGKALDRIGGGIGAKGAGESKLELDRRKIKERITSLNKELHLLSLRRESRRAHRASNSQIVASLVGYTNSGKSSLLNMLTQSTIPVEDKLFATLEPTIRQWYLSAQETILLADTVGFIRNLPKELLLAFMSTLEELYSSTILLHVVDMTHPHMQEHISSVEDILTQMDLIHLPRCIIFNKCDSATEGQKHFCIQQYPRSLFISAKTSEGKKELIHYIAKELPYIQKAIRF
ncbi:MAG: GTPase HflX [Desulfovibrionaceae bacterium]